MADTTTGAAQSATEKKLRPIPFNVTAETRARFLSLFDKSTDEALNKLLNAYEQQQGTAEETDSKLIEDMTSENNRLKNQLSEAQKSAQTNAGKITELEQKIAELESQNKPAENPENEKLKNDLAKAQAELQQARSEMETQRRELNEKETRILNLEQTSVKPDEQITQLQEKLNTANDKIAELEEKLSQTKSDKSGVDDQLKDQLKVIEGYKNTKEEADKQIKNLKKENKDLKEELTKTKNLLDNTSVQGYSGEDDDFLSFFPEVPAQLLKRTVDKINEKRPDEAQITPAILLMDMFLKYTLQKRGIWFYTFVLGDDEIVDIAQSYNPNITSVRMLRRVWNVDSELN